MSTFNPNIQRVALTERDKALAVMPSIMSKFPIEFACGSSMTNITGTCQECGKDIDAEQFTGEVTRPIESVAVVDAVGYCLDCHLISRFFYRLHDDMRMTGKGNDGNWKDWKMHPTWAGRIRRLLRHVFCAQRH